jgi:predicted nucleic acid-binding protein
LTILADTSVWIEYLRTRQSPFTDHFHRLIQSGGVVICGPVLAELVAGGTSDPHAELLARLPFAEIGRSEWAEIGRVVRLLRASGSPTGWPDVAIAVAADSAGVPVWTLDRDFGRIRGVLPALQLYEPL